MFYTSCEKKTARWETFPIRKQQQQIGHGGITLNLQLSTDGNICWLINANATDLYVANRCEYANQKQ